MAYDTSYTWPVGTVITSAEMVQINTNLDWLHTEVVTNRSCSGIGGWYPESFSNIIIDSAQNALAANRVYVATIPIWSPVRILSFAQYAVNGGATGHYGAGIYTLGGTLLCSGVSGNVAANNPILVPVVSPYLINPGMYRLAVTCDAAGILLYVLNDIKFVNNFFNSSTTLLGYTATTSAAGVLPGSINTSLTAISNINGPFPNLWINTTTI